MSSPEALGEQLLIRFKEYFNKDNFENFDDNFLKLENEDENSLNLYLENGTSKITLASCKKVSTKMEEETTENSDTWMIRLLEDKSGLLSS